MALTTSDRIHLIAEIVKRLSAEEWPLLDLVLDQFGRPTQDYWNESKESYVIWSIKDADNETIQGLAEHLGAKAVGGAPAIVPEFWDASNFRLFVSHLATHRAYAAGLQERLAAFGISAFVAHNDIVPTAEWLNTIEQALSTCDALVALFHPDFHVNNWTDQEIGFALGRSVLVLGVRLGLDPYGFAGRFQAFNGLGKTPDAIATELFNALRKNKQTRDQMADVLVTLFEKSPSFAKAKDRIGYLEDMETWKPAFNARLESAVTNNTQVSESFGVPARVGTLLEKWKKA